jgi:type I restriction-modification system DNA methylase subunit/restriction endonuclease S subunit
MGRSTVHYADSETNNILKRLHNKLRPAGTPVERVEYIIELLLLRIFEVKIKQDETFTPLRKLFEGENYRLLFSYLLSLNGEQILSELNKNIFPFYSAIFSKVRTVVSGNLPQKMQDQLVLMEEVFANSNFTNNVKGGVIAEVIGLVNEIEEKYILKTDLLGDAIESALSETGGTKDLGLYRTPGHIRLMMVEMADPDFTDTIFDPACGTAGFLFDAYNYVIKKAQKTRQMPSENVSNIFYRTGIAGIEYLGRIRKMAAVNMYIRGLNPHNIYQGDSLKMFDPSRDAGSKSVVIANPPFGAERDQPAYPNVWEEYSKESETTILFVKLMFELLKKNGRCAVVVSEGFLTWGQNSACALRKLLLNEANLQAIISLPQGVFVSKGGQGAKTSILYFEKGKPTDFVWYYKIENDGFSMGTNRKEIADSQIPELLEFFKEVKQGKKPKDTKCSFCVSKEQIETLDPRVVERIRVEVKSWAIEKNKKKREKLVADLDEKITNKKISKEMYDEKLWQFDNIVEGQIDNEVAKAIEKAHSYHLNLQNYRSNLSAEQIKEWLETMKGVEVKNASSIEKRYQKLQKAEPQIALQILASLDPQNALQMDIVREYLSKLGDDVLEKHEKLKRLDEIMKRGFQYPNIELGSLIIPKYEKIKKDGYRGEYDIIDKISFDDGKIHLREVRETGMDLYRASEGDLITSKINVHQGAMALSPSDLVCSTHYQVYEINRAKINPKYLLLLLRSAKFLEIVNIEKAGGIKNEAGAEFLSKFKIPLPPLEVQNTIVGKIEKHKQIIEGADKIEKEWEPSIDESVVKKLLKEFIADSLYGISSPLNDEGKYPVLRMNNLDTQGNWYLEDLKYVDEEIKEERKLKIGDFLFNRTNSIELVGKSGVINFDFSGTFAGYLIRLRLKNELSPFYLRYLFAQKKYRNYFSSIAKPAGGQANINAEELAQTKIDYYPLEIQRQIVEKFDRQMQALEGVRLLRLEAQNRIEKILACVWGESINQSYV